MFSSFWKAVDISLVLTHHMNFYTQKSSWPNARLQWSTASPNPLTPWRKSFRSGTWFLWSAELLDGRTVSWNGCGVRFVRHVLNFPLALYAIRIRTEHAKSSPTKVLSSVSSTSKISLLFSTFLYRPRPRSHAKNRGELSGGFVVLGWHTSVICFTLVCHLVLC